MAISFTVNKFLWRLGVHVGRFDQFSHPIARRRHLLRSLGITTVLDVGANRGQFANQLRRAVGFTGKILSFEPLQVCFSDLKDAARKDPKWQVLNVALGDTDETMQMNVARNTLSSSLLGMLPRHRDVSDAVHYVRDESVQVRRLDAIFGDLCAPDETVFLKIDTQGYESRVLNGAADSIHRISAVQLEASLVPLYEGEDTFDKLDGTMRQKGFCLIGLEPELVDPASGRILQVNCTYGRE